MQESESSTHDCAEIYGVTPEEWQQYTTDLRAAYGEQWSAEDRERLARCMFQASHIASVKARIEFFKERRKRMSSNSDPEISAQVTVAREVVMAYAKEMATINLTNPATGGAGEVPIGPRDAYAIKAFVALLNVLDEIEDLIVPSSGPGTDTDDQMRDEGAEIAASRISSVIQEALSE